MKDIFKCKTLLNGVPGSRHLPGEQHGAQVSHRLVAVRLEAVQRQGCGGGSRVIHPGSETVKQQAGLWFTQ